MRSMFEVNIDEILRCQTLGEFIIWFETIDDFIEFENVDELLSELALIDRPDYYLHVYFFKQQFLNNG